VHIRRQTISLDADNATETKWGLGLDNYLDLPAENIFNFGLVSLNTLGRL
jgi:hypothetical protein